MMSVESFVPFTAHRNKKLKAASDVPDFSERISNGKVRASLGGMAQTGAKESLALHDSLNGWEQLGLGSVLENVAAYT